MKKSPTGKEIATYLAKKDPILKSVIGQVGPIDPRKGGNYFIELVESVVSQQLSIKAADTIWKRFIALFPKEQVDPALTLDIPDQKIRDVGISWQKISYIKDLAKKTMESAILFEQFEIMTDEEIIQELIKVKGIGRWTAEMFLMFSMGRLDVFSYGDLGLKRAMQKLYRLRKEPSEKTALTIANKWKPYRTLGCRYLWKSLEM
ncbi:MAG: DNA-3-methyladenine glycosylase 2 family protein [Candidatus Levybacteria bacterium]|nr:DNA-3-methyladenine glycosylase 2 family protein [Candidatus Levybacteria bacterium]